MAVVPDQRTLGTRRGEPDAERRAHFGNGARVRPAARHCLCSPRLAQVAGAFHQRARPLRVFHGRPSRGCPPIGQPASKNCCRTLVAAGPSIDLDRVPGVKVTWPNVQSRLLPTTGFGRHAPTGAPDRRSAWHHIADVHWGRAERTQRCRVASIRWRPAYPAINLQSIWFLEVALQRWPPEQGANNIRPTSDQDPISSPRLESGLISPKRPGTLELFALEQEPTSATEPPTSARPRQPQGSRIRARDRAAAIRGLHVRSDPCSPGRHRGQRQPQHRSARGREEFEAPVMGGGETSKPRFD